MVTNNSSTSLVLGLAAFGLTLVVAGVGLYRRRRAASAGENTQDDLHQAPQASQDQSLGAEIAGGRQSHGKVQSNASRENLSLDYFGLVLVLTIPFWLFGGAKLPIPVDLPVSALASFNPLIAALILAYRRDGSRGSKALLRKALDYKKIKHKIWYLPILFLNPMIVILSYAVMRLVELPLPNPQIPWLMAPVFFLAFFIAAIGEELGWMGYAFDPMQDRWGALKASLVLGLVWALFHLIPDVQNGRTANWILWYRLGTVATRVLIVWLYNNTGKSVFATILFHAMDNLSWVLFPNYGSHYNPFITSMITFLVTGIALFGWGSKTLARFRLARLE
jgi:membrane protease YdiL (CAAX protease family)